jgi:carbonic anhydrase
MANIDELLERNKAFARTDAKCKAPAMPFVPNKQTFVITCFDPRVDPAYILGLELGDALVVRNGGGRVTTAVIQDVAWISYLHEVRAPDADWFELVIIHHTDCGSSFLADDQIRRGFSERGFDEKALAELPVIHPAETVRIDVEKITNAPSISARIRISGYSYNVETGLLTTVVPPQSRSDVSS